MRFRRRLRVRTADDAATERALSALVLGAEDNPLELDVKVGPVRPEGGKVELVLQLPLANLALVPDGTFHIGRISVFAVAGDLGGGSPKVVKAVVPVRIANDDLLTALGRKVEYRFDFPEAGGGAEVGVGVRDDFVPVTAAVRLPRPAEPPDGASAGPSL